MVSKEGARDEPPGVTLSACQPLTVPCCCSLEVRHPPPPPAASARGPPFRPGVCLPRSSTCTDMSGPVEVDRSHTPLIRSCALHCVVFLCRQEPCCLSPVRPHMAHSNTPPPVTHTLRGADGGRAKSPRAAFPKRAPTRRRPLRKPDKERRLLVRSD